MLTLWYLILGWKEYNKPFVKREKEPEKPGNESKKPDLIPQKPDGRATDGPKPPAVPPRPQPAGVAAPEPPKPTLPKDIPKPNGAGKVPDLPKVPDRPAVPELPKVSPTLPKRPEMPAAPKTPESPKVPDLPKPSAALPKGPEPAKPAPKTPESPRVPELPKGPTGAGGPGVMPSKRPESVMPTFPASGKNPVATTNQEFPLPPYLPGAPSGGKPTPPPTRGDELFDVGNRGQDGNRSGAKGMANLRDLSYAKGELPEEAFDQAKKKAQDALSKVPKYVEDVVSNPDSLGSSEAEEDEDEEEDEE